MTTDATEFGLVRAATAGDQIAFTRLVEPHRNRLWATCLRICGNPTDAEDAMQESLLAAWRGLPSFRGDAKFSTWLYRIASNASIAQSKKRLIVDDIDDKVVSSGVDIASSVTSAAGISAAIGTLPDAFRVTFVLRVYGDLSYQEIADHLGVPVQTVRSRLSRAKAILQRELSASAD